MGLGRLRNKRCECGCGKKSKHCVGGMVGEIYAQSHHAGESFELDLGVRLLPDGTLEGGITEPAAGSFDTLLHLAVETSLGRASIALPPGTREIPGPTSDWLRRVCPDRVILVEGARVEVGEKGPITLSEEVLARVEAARAGGPDPPRRIEA